MRFSRSLCLLLTEFFLSIRTKISVRSLPLCQIIQIFTVSFQSYFRSKYKFCKIFGGTRSVNLHLREPGVLARARAVSGPGCARQETISSHLKLAGYFAKHIQARILKRLITSTCSFGMQLAHDLLINLHSNNYHLISRCCHGNKTKNPRWPPSWIFEF